MLMFVDVDIQNGQFAKCVTFGDNDYEYIRTHNVRFERCNVCVVPRFKQIKSIAALGVGTDVIFIISLPNNFKYSYQYSYQIPLVSASWLRCARGSE